MLGFGQGEDGLPGDPGEKGAAGVGIDDIVFESGTLVITLTSGDAFPFDLSDLMEKQIIEVLNKVDPQEVK